MSAESDDENALAATVKPALAETKPELDATMLSDGIAHARTIPPDRTDGPAQMIGRYRVTGVLGSGGMGIVYSASRPAMIES